MTPTERQYLYGAGGRRHITNPTAPERMFAGTSWCGRVFDTESLMEANLRWWQGNANAEPYIAKQKALPICKLCERAEEKAK